jgi:hypothetical protein
VDFLASQTHRDKGHYDLGFGIDELSTMLLYESGEELETEDAGSDDSSDVTTPPQSEKYQQESSMPSRFSVSTSSTSSYIRVNDSILSSSLIPGSCCNPSPLGDNSEATLRSSQTGPQLPRITRTAEPDQVLSSTTTAPRRIRNISLKRGIPDLVRALSRRKDTRPSNADRGWIWVR